jgi:hypothetical protein
MKPLNKTAIAAVLLVCCIAVGQDKKPEPSLDETSKWITAKLAEAGKKEGNALSMVHHFIHYSSKKKQQPTTSDEVVRGLSTDSHAIENAEITNCVLTYTDIATYSETDLGTTNYRYDYTIPLSKVEKIDIEHVLPRPSTVEKKDSFYTPLDEDQVVVTTTFFGESWHVNIHAPAIVKTTTSKPGVAGEAVSSNHYDSSNIPFGLQQGTNEDNASRLKKALEHAVELCKQKPEPF